MNREIISDKQGITLTILFFFGSSVLIGSGYSARQDIWLAAILAFAFGFLMLRIYARILFLFPKRDLFDILDILLGKFGGKAVSLVFIWFAFHLGSLVLINFGEYMKVITLPNTPKFVPMLIFILLCKWGVTEGIEVISRLGEFFILIIFIIFILSFTLITTLETPGNLLPVLQNGFKPVLSGALAFFSFPIGESVVFIMIFSCLKDRSSSFKIYKWGLLLGCSFVLIISIRNVLVLGPKAVTENFFASYIALARVDIRGFFQRVEIAISVVFLITGFIKTSVCLLAVTKGLSKLFNTKDYKFLVTPVALLMFNLAYFIYPNTNEMYMWATKIWPYYAFPFQAVLPVIIFIIAEIKTRGGKVNPY